VTDQFTVKHWDAFQRTGRGTFARLDPAPSRTVVNKGETKARVLIVSAPVTSGYDPPDWA
jgi:hypothetical protein